MIGSGDKPNFDDIVRNLLVFLKGQVPSLQARHSREEVAHQIQSIVYMLRTSIIQLEGSAFSDPKNTNEYKALCQDLEALKKTNQRLEESLFLEMNKSQRLTGELEKSTSLLEGREKLVSEKDIKINELTSAVEKMQSRQGNQGSDSYFAEKTALEESLKSCRNECVELNLRLRNSADEFEKTNDQLRSSQEELVFAKEALNKSKEEINQLKGNMTREAGGVLHTQTNLQDLLSEISKLKIEIQEKEIEHQSLLTTKDSLFHETESIKTENTQLKKHLSDLKSSSITEIEAGKLMIKTLHERVEKMQKMIDSAPNQEVVTNLQASTQARLAFLEKALVDAKKQNSEHADRMTHTPEQVEEMQKDKFQLEQRIIDLEATVRRLTANRGKMMKESAMGLPILKSEEYVFFFEILSSISSRLAKSPENKDIRQKAEEAIGMLEKSHAIESIPALGCIFDDKMHKVVRSFFSPILEDGTIINEIGKGFRSSDHIIQRAVVWVSKSRFKCIECRTPARPQDNFCQRCGLELCSPDGTTKKKIPPLPTTVDICFPLIDHLIGRGQTKPAIDLLAYVSKDHPDHPGCLQRRNALSQLTGENQ